LLQIILNIFYGLKHAMIKSCIGLHFFNIFLFSRTYLSISHCEACNCSCLLTSQYVIKSIMLDANLKQNFRFSQKLDGLEE